MANARKKQTKKKANSLYEYTRIALGQQSYGKRQFKRDIRKLQKSGLISGKIDIDLQTPTKYMLGQIRKFKDVLSGAAKTIAINPGERAQYRASMYKVKNGRAIIPTPQGESVKRLPNAGGVARFQMTPKKGTRGLKRVETLIPYTGLEEYIMNTINAAPDLPRDQYYGFRYFGNNSIRYYRGDDDGRRRMTEYVLNYPSVQEAIANGNVEVEDEIYQNFQVVKIIGQPGKNMWESGIQKQRDRARREYREANREHRIARQRQRLASMDEEQRLAHEIRKRENRESDRESKQRMREKIRTTDIDAYNAYREAAKKRAAKSRAKKKPK